MRYIWIIHSIIFDTDKFDTQKSNKSFSHVSAEETVSVNDLDGWKWKQELLGFRTLMKVSFYKNKLKIFILKKEFVWIW